MLPDQGIQVLMLGTFRLFYNGEPVSLKKKETTKPVQLLQLLLYNREQGVSRNTVIEEVFGGAGDMDISNTLNATISQLRRLLRESGLPQENYIKVRFDRYFFQSPFPIYIDTEVVTQLRRQADLSSGTDQMTALYQLCALYRGRLLPALDGTEWVEIGRAHYQRIFRDSMGQILSTLEKQRSYGEILRLSELAASIFPFDEWQVWQQESLLAQGRLMDARQLYLQVEKLYQKELDALPPEQMRLRLQTEPQDNWREPGQIGDVCSWLASLEDPGPAYVPYPAFAEAFRLLSSSGGARTILLCTLPDPGKRPGSLHDSVEQLVLVLKRQLSAGDLFTRYSRTQILVVSHCREASSGEALGQRIKEDFHRQTGSNKLTVQCRSC